MHTMSYVSTHYDLINHIVAIITAYSLIANETYNDVFPLT